MKHPDAVRLDRRQFLKAASATGAAAALSACGSSRAPTAMLPGDSGLVNPPDGAVFVHGVASGDPLHDRVMLWTRVTDDAQSDVVNVVWQMASDPEFGTVVATGAGTTGPARDYTFKVDVSGLQAATTYYYRFTALGQTSAIGRTKTLPVGTPEDLRFAVVSCSSFPHGFFNAYARIAERPDMDFVLCLGDYIYEYGNGPGEYGSDVQAGGRVYEPDHEMVTLEDYRLRHGLYKRDRDLQELHRQYAFINVWDDHETTNDSFNTGAENHQPATEGDWLPRKAVALQAYFEWLPIRQTSPGEGVADDTATNDERTFRTFAIGDLADLIMLDTRLYGREEAPVPNGVPIANTGFSTFFDSGDVAADRQLLGEEQETWFFDQLDSSTARWKIIGQQIMFGQLKFQGAPNASNLQTMGGQGGQFINPDQWDGYLRARERVWAAIRGGQAAPAVGVNNVVVLTGDIHTSWAMDITEDPNNPLAYNPADGTGSMAVEFVATSVTSPGLDELQGAGDQGLLTQNPHMKYIELSQHGYVIVTADATRCQGDWFFVDDILAPSSGEAFATAWTTADGDNHLTEAAAPAPARDNPPMLAP